MSKVTGNDKTFMDINTLSFRSLSFGLWIIYYVFFATLLFGIFRLVLVLYFAVRQKYHMSPKRKYEKNDTSVSVIVPAYNESVVIAKTIDSLLMSTYSTFDIIVIDDGSTDDTGKIVEEKYRHNPRVRLLQKTNSGKGKSMNYGIDHTDAEIIIVIDADTIFTPTTIGMLIRHFEDPRVGAVSGNVKVGNRDTLLTKFQSLEYISNQNIDKRAYDALGTITVVPGAV